MTAAEFRFHPSADAEFAQAMLWYSAHGERLPMAFEEDLERTLSLILDAPDRLPLVDDVHRTLALRKFPYFLIYRQT